MEKIEYYIIEVHYNEENPNELDIMDGVAGDIIENNSNIPSAFCYPLDNKCYSCEKK